MRLYSRKFAKRKIDNRVKRKQETRDGVLWSVDTESQTCIVRIQGSITGIVAHYPRNLKELPYYMRPGVAVRIGHKDGIRGFVEVIGEGRAIPDGTVPSVGSPGDAILTGLKITASSPATDGVSVSEGTYRIDGTTYFSGGSVSGYITMNDPAPMTMGELTGDAQNMGEVVLTLGPEPATLGDFRYDAIFVGIDGTIDVVEGAEVTWSAPTLPSTPPDHLLVGFVLRFGGADDIIEQEWVGYGYTTPNPVDLVIDFWRWDGGTGRYYKLTDQRPSELYAQTMTFDPATPDELGIRVSLISQYNAIPIPTSFAEDGAWVIRCDFTSGSGEVSASGSSFSATDYGLATWVGFDSDTVFMWGDYSDEVLFEYDHGAVPTFSPWFQFSIVDPLAVDNKGPTTLYVYDAGGLLPWY